MISKKIQSLIQKKCKNIKLVITDVDGVLTDGGRFYNSKGEFLKKFHVRDGMGVNLLLRHSIPTCIVTKENSDITKKWASDMNVKKIYADAFSKEKVLPDICKSFNVSPQETAYIGDDINDESLLQSVGFSACPNDASMSTQKIVDYVCTVSGGHGAFREITDIILTLQTTTETN